MISSQSLYRRRKRISSIPVSVAMKPFTGLKAIYKGVFNAIEKQEIYKNFTKKNAPLILLYKTVNYDQNFFIVFLRTPFQVAHKLKLAYLEENLRFEIYFDEFTKKLMPNVLLIMTPQRGVRNVHRIRMEVENNRGKFLDVDSEGNPLFLFDSFVEAAVAHHYMHKRFSVYFASKLLLHNIQQNKNLTCELVENFKDDGYKSFYDGDDDVSFESKSESGAAVVYRQMNSLEPEKVTVTYSDTFDYSMSQFPDIKLVLPRPPKEEPSMKDLKDRVKDLRIERRVKIRAEAWRYFANEE